VTTPVELTIAIDGADDDHITVPVLFAADSWVLCPTRSMVAGGGNSSPTRWPDESHATTKELKRAVTPITNFGRRKHNSLLTMSISDAYWRC